MRSSTGRLRSWFYGTGVLLAAVMVAGWSAPPSVKLAQRPAPPPTAKPAAPGGAPATPAQNGANAPAADDNRTAWTLRCDTRCSVFQSLSVRRGNAVQRLLTITVQTQEKSTEDYLLLSLPHGLYLPAGVELQVDDAKAEKVDIETSDTNGAYAGTKFTPALLSAFKGGKSLKVTMVSADRKRITVPAPLKGFDDAYDKFLRLKK